MDHMQMDGPMTSTTRKDPAAGHGMLVVGVDTSFFYHLPMFGPPHDFQVILEGTLSQAGSDPQRRYRDDRIANAQTRVYTLAPVPFILPDLFPPTFKRKKIQGDLFRGHFESPPEYPAAPVAVATGVDVTVANVVFVQKLLPLPAPLEHLEYVLFGKGKELFLAHVLTKHGDFDQVMSAEIRGHQFLDEELRHGIRVQFPAQRNEFAQRFVKGKAVSGTAQLAEKKFAIDVVPKVEFYMSRRDLI